MFIDVCCHHKKCTSTHTLINLLGWFNWNEVLLFNALLVNENLYIDLFANILFKHQFGLSTKNRSKQSFFCLQLSNSLSTFLLLLQ